MTRTDPLWHTAAAFAGRAHVGQVRRDGVTPYVMHPARVALTCALVFGIDDERILAAAYLHDVIEDCTVDRDELEEEFGAEVAEIVATLSKDTRMQETEREIAYDAQLADGPVAARLIKLADTYDNLLDAETPEARRSCAERAERALALAADDPEAAAASAAVRSLLRSL